MKYGLYAIGNLTRDPQRGTTHDVVNFDIAVNRRLQDGTKSAEYIHCAAWGKLGEIVEQYCRKGMMVYVHGRPSARAFEGRDGSKRASLDLTIDDLTMLSSKRDMEAKASAQTIYAEVDDDELPFN